MTSSQNSVESKFGGGGAERLNGQKLFFLGQSIDNLKLHSIGKNQPLRLIRRGNMRVFPFLALKRQFLSYVSSKLS